MLRVLHLINRYNHKVNTYVFDPYNNEFINPITGESGAYPRLMFLLALYYLQVMCGYDLEKALRVALDVKTVDKVLVANESRAFAAEKLKMKDFNDFIECFL